MNNTNQGILAVSFGTMNRETCDKTIGAIEDALAEAFPERKLYRAWMSSFIIQKLRSTQEIRCDTLEEALDRMREEGITDLIVQPTHLLDGFENKRMQRVIGEKAAGSFDKVAIGAHLLDSSKDLSDVADIIIDDIYGPYASGRNSALVLMGHGNRHDPAANRVYADLQNCLRSKGYETILVGTVEGEPTLEDVRSALDRNTAVTDIAIAPLMIVAGNHALHDMAGDEETSWKNVLASTGRNVDTILKGLGEYDGIRRLLTEHARKATTI